MVTDGGANPYSLNGGAGLTIKFNAEGNATFQCYFGEGLADIAAGAKNITFTPGAAQSYQVAIWMG